MAQRRDTVIAPPSNPGASATATLWDSTWDVGGTKTSLTRRDAYRHIQRITVTVFADQVVTVFFDGVEPGSTTFRTINGGGLGEATTASAYFSRDFFKTGTDVRVRIVTTTGPTVWEVSCRLSEDRAPSA